MKCLVFGSFLIASAFRHSKKSVHTKLLKVYGVENCNFQMDPSLVLPMVPFGFEPLPIRHSAFAAVLSSSRQNSNAAATCASTESSPAITVEVKRKPIVSEDEDSPSTAKKAKLEDFSMRLPASAQSSICQQRARECLDSQQRKLCEKQQQQKNRYK